MSTLSFLLGLFFATFNNTAAPVHTDGGKKTETQTSTGKDRADFIIGDDTVGRKL